MGLTSHSHLSVSTKQGSLSCFHFHSHIGKLKPQKKCREKHYIIANHNYAVHLTLFLYIGHRPCFLAVIAAAMLLSSAMMIQDLSSYTLKRLKRLSESETVQDCLKTLWISMDCVSMLHLNKTWSVYVAYTAVVHSSAYYY